MLDPERQMRVVYPPVFFVGSLAWGLYLDSPIKFQSMFAGAIAEPVNHLLALALAGGIVAIASGFIIGSVGILALRLAFRPFTPKSYEACLSNPALGSIRHRVGQLGRHYASDALYLSATLDHELLPPAIHRWVFRRWSMFYVSANSATALLLALLVGWDFGIRLRWAWLLQSLALVLLLIVAAVFVARDDGHAGFPGSTPPTAVEG